MLQHCKYHCTAENIAGARCILHRDWKRRLEEPLPVSKQARPLIPRCDHNHLRALGQQLCSALIYIGRSEE